jgi:hypothetical protein
METNGAKMTDWPNVFRAIDRDIAAWTPEILRAAYVAHGCAVVRGAIDLDMIASLRRITSDIYDRTSSVHVHDPEIAEATQGERSGFDLISHPALKRFLDLIFVGQRYRREDSTARRISGTEMQSDWQPPLELHVDSYFHQFWFTVNFWVPFDECGMDAPCLQLLPVNYRETRRYVGFSRQPVHEYRDGTGNSRYFPAGTLAPDRVQQDFGEGCLFRPTMKPGDVIIASNWIVHGSYRTPNMRSGRSSMEVRFIGQAPDIAVRPDASDWPRIAAWVWATRTGHMLGIRSDVAMPFWAK